MITFLIFILMGLLQRTVAFCMTETGCEQNSVYCICVRLEWMSSAEGHLSAKRHRLQQYNW